MPPPAPRLPPWIREKKLNLAGLHQVKSLLREKELNSVCESLACPNRSECFSRGTATFMILGDVCTRSCGFCNVTSGRPYAPPSPDEPRHIAEAARRMNLAHVVVTCVTRDDLPDGGAMQFVGTIEELRRELPGTKVEVLTSDFRGQLENVETVARALPDYFNHNVETVPRLHDVVRKGAKFDRSLAVLRRAKETSPSMVMKSGLMLGFGERKEEVHEVMQALLGAGVRIMTIGQYLQPNLRKLAVVEYVHPDVFEEYRLTGEAMGFSAVFAGPFVRSSYMADAVAHEAEDRAG
ncbi:MAG TPA: lipoyl synthase [Thermoanaerobaculia bacterium]|nr:lipoyl synthase [Thermoanaerobaculia bacterium]